MGISGSALLRQAVEARSMTAAHCTSVIEFVADLGPSYPPARMISTVPLPELATKTLSVVVSTATVLGWRPVG